MRRCVPRACIGQLSPVGIRAGKDPLGPAAHAHQPPGQLHHHLPHDGSVDACARRIGGASPATGLQGGASYVYGILLFVLSGAASHSVGLLFGSVFFDIRKALASCSVFLLACMVGHPACAPPITLHSSLPGSTRSISRRGLAGCRTSASCGQCTGHICDAVTVRRYSWQAQARIEFQDTSFSCTNGSSLLVCMHPACINVSSSMCSCARASRA